MPFGSNGLSRRTVLKAFGAQALALAAGRAVSLAAAPTAATFLQGINAYYLLVESYRRVQRHRQQTPRAAVRAYLVDALRLPEVRERCHIDSIRYWAFNDSPDLSGVALPGAGDGRLWLTPGQADPLAMETLGCLTEQLAGLGFTLVPVLSNFWPSYGGILQYLVWTGELAEQEYIDALRSTRTAALYLDHTMTFFTSAAAEELFRQHINTTLALLRPLHSIHTIELMNEPRGKNACSLAHHPLTNGRMSADIVAAWLNRQAAWIRRTLALVEPTPFLSSGEEGWLEQPPSVEQFSALAPHGQHYEGIDLAKNVSRQRDGIDIGSIHLYPHIVTSLPQKNVCGNEFIDQRGWSHLSNDPSRTDKEHYITLADEWITSRARALRGTPWYIGEMGWCWPDEENQRMPAAGPALLRERHQLYRRWGDIARDHGALGVFVWMLNGLDHQDDFYGMDRRALEGVITGNRV